MLTLKRKKNVNYQLSLTGFDIVNHELNMILENWQILPNMSPLLCFIWFSGQNCHPICIFDICPFQIRLKIFRKYILTVHHSAWWMYFFYPMIHYSTIVGSILYPDCQRMCFFAGHLIILYCNLDQDQNLFYHHQCLCVFVFVCLCICLCNSSSTWDSLWSSPPSLKTLGAQLLWVDKPALSAI